MAPSATNINDSANGTAKMDFTTFHNVINGKLVPTSKTRHGINPATKKANLEVPISTPQDVDNAVAAAKAAFKKWSRTSLEERRTALTNYANALVEHREDFAKLLTTEQGKPVSETRHWRGDGRLTISHE